MSDKAAAMFQVLSRGNWGSGTVYNSFDPRELFLYTDERLGIRYGAVDFHESYSGLPQSRFYSFREERPDVARQKYLKSVARLKRRLGQ